MKQPYLVCGTIVNTHGVRGAVKIESHCDSPKVLAELPRLFLQTKEGIYEERKVVKASVGGGRVLAYLEGVETLDDAIPLKGKTVYAKREELPLPKGAHFIADLIGLPMIDADTGRVYGEVTAVENMPSSDMYTVLLPSGAEVLFPAVKEFLKEIRLDEGIFISPIEGMFED
jgi:16S rRNA processing protein RimM